MKRILSLLLVVVLLVGCCAAFASCGGDSKDPSEVKAALIALHGTSSTYDKNFIEAFKTACQNKGLKEENYTIITDIPEGTECYDEAANFADEGYDVMHVTLPTNRAGKDAHPNKEGATLQAEALAKFIKENYPEFN